MALNKMAEHLRNTASVPITLWKHKPEEAPFSWSAHVRRFTEKEFKQRYRLDFDNFKNLSGPKRRFSIA